MLLQTNSYIVPKEKRAEHARLLRRFRQTLGRLGCDHFEVFEQVGANWSVGEPTGRYVQIMRFRDRKHQQQVQAAERADPAAQALINEFCQLINFPYQQQQGLFATGFYNSVMPVGPGRSAAATASPVAPGEVPTVGTTEPQSEVEAPAEVLPPTPVQPRGQQPRAEPAEANPAAPKPPNGQHVEEELDLRTPEGDQDVVQGRGQYQQDYREVSLLNLSGDADDLGDLDLETDRQRPQANRNGV